MIVIRIKPQSIRISIKPSKGERRPKNRIDQIKFKKSCKAKSLRAFFTFSFFTPFCHTRKADNPISIYSIVQTGPKTKLGGENGGLFKVLYQEGMAFMVKGVARIPANSQTITKINNINKFFTT